VLNWRVMRKIAEKYRQRLAIRANSINSPIMSLSGGNQQKAIIARWMATKPDIILADDLTRGISISSKMQIYRLIREMAAAGTAIVLVSSEFEELVGLCSRVYIVHGGRTQGQVDTHGMTAEDLLHTVLAKAS
jgi:ABC-type sugar transport system ATPase subunit